jgi:hypothetical protein
MYNLVIMLYIYGELINKVYVGKYFYLKGLVNY